MHENVLDTADEELRRSAGALFWSSLAAGLLMGWSFVASAYAATMGSPLRAGLRAAAAYPLGFILVIIGRNQLFTENTLEPVIPLLEDRDLQTLKRVLRLWAIVLFGNLLGGLAFALLAARTVMLGGELDPHLLRISHEAISGGFGHVFYLAIFAGWLIALTAWLVQATERTLAQIVLIWLTIAPISAFGFRHSIAGAVEAFYLAAIGGTGWGNAVGGFVIPAVIGNIVGGVIFVALLNHGQVAAERRRR
ncbi:MAG TPA: formate/nitrite transporter family protein [Gemmatimonadaceae bacterium]|nr:formate/nitrite transporter family protein [Gemmatimonadaceae bacterium]